MPPAIRVVKVRTISKPTLNVKVTLDKESYFQGDDVNAKIEVSLPDGNPL